MPPKPRTKKAVTAAVEPSVIDSLVLNPAPVVEVAHVSVPTHSPAPADTPALPALPPVAPVPAPAAPTAPVATKKGKKAPKVVAIVTPDGIEGSFLPPPRRPLIAHLQISSSEVQFHDRPLQYDPAPPGQPEPYDSSITDMFTQQNYSLDMGGMSTKEVTPTDNQESQRVVAAAVPAAQKPVPVCLDAFTKCELLLEFRETKTTKKLPEHTDIACFWCAHTFTWQPAVIPEREEKGTYRVYGNFCGPCCSMAYLLNESLDTHVRWERIALLHRLYGSGYPNGRIFPAPTRQSLQLFGGPMHIEQYRATISAGKVRVDIQNPPMVSILGSIDTKPIDFYDSSMKHTISPLLGEIVPKAEEGLRLKRSKPLKEKDSTLDSVLKIQIKAR